MAKVMVATPAYGEVLYTPDVESLIKLIRSMHQNKWDCSFRSISYSEISESRNYLLTSWFDKTDASHILFLDADMGFKPQLISEMVAVDQPVVGVISPKRNIDLCHVAKHAADGVPVDLAIARAQQFVFVRHGGKASGTAGMAFWRSKHVGREFYSISCRASTPCFDSCRTSATPPPRRQALSPRSSTGSSELSTSCTSAAPACRKIIHSVTVGSIFAREKSGRASRTKSSMSDCRNSRFAMPTSCRFDPGKRSPDDWAFPFSRAQISPKRRNRLAGERPMPQRQACPTSMMS